MVVTVGDAPKVSAPSNTAMPDTMLASVTKQNDGAFYLNITGQFSYADPSKIDPAIYQAERNRVRAAADIGADVTIYGGPCDVTTPTVQDSLTWNGSYRFMTRQGASVVMLAASKGIRATDPSQYGRMIMDLDAANDNNIIIVTDLTPSDYPSQAETSYFRAILSKYVAQGKNVFVVSGTGTAYWASIKDGTSICRICGGQTGHQTAMCICSKSVLMAVKQLTNVSKYKNNTQKNNNFLKFLLDFL